MEDGALCALGCYRVENIGAVSRLSSRGAKEHA